MTPYARAQLDITALLNSLAYCADIPVLAWRPRATSTGAVETAPAIQSKIDLALAGVTTKGGKSGLGILVLMPVVTVDQGSGVGPATVIATSIRIRERTIINMSASGTLKPAEDVAWELQRRLHHYCLGYSTLYCEGQSIAPVLDPTDTSGDVIYNLEVSQKVTSAIPTRVGRVVMTSAALTVTLTTPTSGAAIYYTTDDSFPCPENTAAQSYATPFLVDTGTYVRAAAFKTGLDPSIITAASITT